MKTAEWLKKIVAKDRAALARAFTLVESVKAEHEADAVELLEKCDELTKARQSDAAPMRLAITGLPGAGKSTLIEALGRHLTAQKKTVAVLAIDPSSQLTGGSILGDKTRMVELSQDPLAFIRPSPSSGVLGGVSPRTRRSLALCEAAGFDVIFIETVGVGQSEARVADMVDLVLLTLIAGAGDELQGIKRGILEIADLIAINKADGEALKASDSTRAEYENAARISGHPKPVLTLSALEKKGIEPLWSAIETLHREYRDSGRLSEKKNAQRMTWFREDLTENLGAMLEKSPVFSSRIRHLTEQIRKREISPVKASAMLSTEVFQKLKS